MGGSAGSKEAKPKKEESMFYRKQMISSHKAFSIAEEYELIEKIGDGTYAEVFKARSKRTKKICAIKKVDKSKVKGISILLQNQFSILRELDHPNIIKVNGMYEDSKDFYIVSELAKGKELYEYFKEKKRLAQKQAFTIFNQVFLAVNHLHQNNIMHRDIKLENIIYDPSTRILKLLDFGSATQYQTKTPCPYKCVGTVSYIAPEVIDKLYNYKCDNWSLGVFLYLLLSGTTPFAGKDQEETFQKIKKQPLQFSKAAWETISSDAKKLIQSLMEKNPQKRIQLDQVIKNNWFSTQRNSQSISQQDQNEMMMVLGRLRKFGKVKLAEIQLGVLVFMINLVVGIEKEEQMIRCFHMIDSGGDGVISVPELVQAMIEYEDRSLKVAEAEAKEIMARIDFNNSLDISYSQYLVAAADIEKILTDENLEKTFVMIDTDKSAKLSVNEIKAKLGGEISEAYYAKLISFFDEDKDGEISFSEFKRMMKKLLK